MFHLEVEGSSQEAVRNNEVTKYLEEGWFPEMAALSPSPQVCANLKRFSSLYLSVRESTVSFQKCMEVMASFPSGASGWCHWH